MNYNPHKPMMTYKQGLGSRGSAIGTVLPLNGEPFEVDIPKGCAKKEDLKEYLSTLPIFKTKDDFEYNEKIELGFYWRNIMTDYKKTPRTCLIFRFSKGTVLPENHLCQFWRADPWKKTYGPIIILRIQDGNTQFRYEDYRLTDYHRQCFYNLQQQQQFFNPASKNYVGNQGGQTASPAPTGLPALTMGGERDSPMMDPSRGGYPPSSTLQGNNPYSQPRNVSPPYPTSTTNPTTSTTGGAPNRFGTPSHYSTSATSTPSSFSTSFNRTTGGGFTSPGYTPSNTTTRTTPPQQPVVNPFSSTSHAKLHAGAAPFTPQGRIVTGCQTPFHGMQVNETMELSNFQAKIIELSNLSVPERWIYNVDDSRYKNPVLFHYIYFLILKAIKVPVEKELVVLGNRMILNTGLKKKGTMMDIMMVCKKVTDAQNMAKCHIEKFVTWYDVITTLREFRSFQRPSLIEYSPRTERFHPEYYIDFNFDKLYKENRTYFPGKWDSLAPYQLRLLFSGAAMIVRKRISENPSFVAKAVFQDENMSVNIQYLIPFHLSNNNNVASDDDDEASSHPEMVNVYEGFVDFVIAVRAVKTPEGPYYLGSAVLSADWSYTCARACGIPQQRWLFLGDNNKSTKKKITTPQLEKKQQLLANVDEELEGDE